MRKYILSRHIASGLLLLSVVATLYVVILYVDRDRLFDAMRWEKAADKPNPSIRYQMASSLVSILRSNTTIGTKGVVALLGRPDRSNVQDIEIDDARTGSYMAYKLGGKSRVLPAGRYFLIITFNVSGVVSRADIVPE